LPVHSAVLLGLLSRFNEYETYFFLFCLEHNDVVKNALHARCNNSLLSRKFRRRCTCE